MVHSTGERTQVYIAQIRVDCGKRKQKKSVFGGTDQKEGKNIITIRSVIIGRVFGDE